MRCCLQLSGPFYRYAELLTNIAATIFCGIGAGLMGRVGPIWWVPIVVATLAAQ